MPDDNVQVAEPAESQQDYIDAFNEDDVASPQKPKDENDKKDTAPEQEPDATPKESDTTPRPDAIPAPGDAEKGKDSLKDGPPAKDVPPVPEADSALALAQARAEKKAEEETRREKEEPEPEKKPEPEPEPEKKPEPEPEPEKKPEPEPELFDSAKFTKELVKDIPEKVEVDDNEYDMKSFREDFPEAAAYAEELVKGLAEKLVERFSGTNPKPVDLDKYMKEENVHGMLKNELDMFKFDMAVEKAHPDILEMTRTKDFEDWLGKQTVGIQGLYQSPDPDDAIALLDAYVEFRDGSSKSSKTSDKAKKDHDRQVALHRDVTSRRRSPSPKASDDGGGGDPEEEYKRAFYEDDDGE